MSLTSTVLNFDQSFSFCGYGLSGISDLTFASDFGIGFAATLGAKSFGYHKLNPSVGTVEFSRSLICADPVFNYTGDIACSGSFAYGNTMYGFNSGYLSSYAVSCGIGQVPAVNSSIIVYGEMSTGVAGQVSVEHPEIFIPSQRSIVITNDYNSSNRIRSFNYSLSIGREPKYSIDSGLTPDRIVQKLPIPISASAVFDVAGFSPLDLQKFVREIYSPNFSISIKNRDLSTTLMTLPVTNAQILSQQIQGTIDSPLSLTLNYGGFLE